jgi:hypothetical protein
MTKTPLTGIQVRSALVRVGLNPNKFDEKAIYNDLADGDWEGELSTDIIIATAQNFFRKDEMTSEFAPKSARSHIAN